MLTQAPYTLIVYNRPNRTTQTFDFNNLRQALNSFIERCDTLDLQYREDNNGNFIADDLGRDWTLELISNF
jgi:hypothetical protein